MLTLTSDLVEIVHIATFINEVFAFDGVVDEVDAVVGAELSVTHLNGNGRQLAVGVCQPRHPRPSLSRPAQTEVA